LPLATLLLVATSLIALCVGRYPVPLADVVRTLAAILVGAALAVSGGTYQAVFRNPLVSPGTLGVLGGAAFGAALAIVLGAHGAWIQVSAFGAGVAAVLVGLGVAAMLQRGSILTLMLGGLISSALFSSLLAMLKHTADPQDALPAIVFWMLGSLAQASWPARAGCRRTTTTWRDAKRAPRPTAAPAVRPVWSTSRARICRPTSRTPTACSRATRRRPAPVTPAISSIHIAASSGKSATRSPWATCMHRWRPSASRDRTHT
jgi:hypothetical protein